MDFRSNTEIKITSVDYGFQKVCFPGFRIPRPEFQISKQILFGFRIPRAKVSDYLIWGDVFVGRGQPEGCKL